MAVGIEHPRAQANRVAQCAKRLLFRRQRDFPRLLRYRDLRTSRDIGSGYGRRDARGTISRCRDQTGGVKNSRDRFVAAGPRKRSAGPLSPQAGSPGSGASTTENYAAHDC